MKEASIQRLKKIGRYLLHVLHKVLQIWDRITVCILAVCILAGVFWYGFRRTESEEAAARSRVVQTAQTYLGVMESDGSHRKIIDRYNAHEPRARYYEVTYEDSWCAVFGSVVALETDMLGWIPLECSCEQQILLFEAQNQWVENDCYFPKPGDYIFYDWNSSGSGDCTGWSDHVGIVVSTFGPAIKVIEGNKNDDVSYRYIFVNDPYIRGFGTPDYAGFADQIP